jgi:hypothetical protein
VEVTGNGELFGAEPPTPNEEADEREPVAVGVVYAGTPLPPDCDTGRVSSEKDPPPLTTRPRVVWTRMGCVWSGTAAAGIVGGVGKIG